MGTGGLLPRRMPIMHRGPPLDTTYHDSESGSSDSDSSYDSDSHDNNEELQYWIRIKNLLATTPTKLLNQCKDEIIEQICGGMDNFIHFIVDNSKQRDLKQIHAIIKNINLKNKKLERKQSMNKRGKKMKINLTFYLMTI